METGLVQNAALICSWKLRWKKLGEYSTDERTALLQYTSFDDRQIRISPIPFRDRPRFAVRPLAIQMPASEELTKENSASVGMLGTSRLSILYGTSSGKNHTLYL